MNDPRNAQSRRLIDGLSMLCAAVLVIAGVGVARTITARADVSPAWDGPFGAKLANQDVFNRCGADVIVVVDLTVSGNDPAQRSATTAALGNVLATVARQGNRWAVVGYGGNAQVIGAPADAAFTPSDPTLPVTDTVDKIAELFAAPAEPSPARNWEAGLRLAADVANQAPADRPLSVVHLGRDTPTRHLANGVATTEPQDAADTSAAATAADTLRGRPSTHIYGIAVDAEGDALTTAWSAVSGPDRVVFGSRPLTAATDDLVAVPASGDLPAALAALATSFCTTSIDLTALAGKAGDQPASATTITVKPLGESTALTLAGEPAERKTSDAGKAQWHVAAASSAPFDIELTDTSATAGEASG